MNSWVIVSFFLVCIIVALVIGVFLFYLSLDTNQELIYKQLKKINEQEIEELKDLIYQQDKEIKEIKALILKRSLEIEKDNEEIKQIEQAIKELEAGNGK